MPPLPAYRLPPLRRCDDAADGWARGAAFIRWRPRYDMRWPRAAAAGYDDDYATLPPNGPLLHVISAGREGGFSREPAPR